MNYDDDRSVDYSVNDLGREQLISLDSESIYSDESKDSQRSRNSKHSRTEKKEENRSAMYTIKRKIDKKFKKINIFNTAIHINAPIVNAVSGYPYSDDEMKLYRVGSFEEMLFFKVRFLTYENGMPGLTLFYENPEQYERHLGNPIDENTKRQYYEQRRKYERGEFHRKRQVHRGTNKF